MYLAKCGLLTGESPVMVITREPCIQLPLHRGMESLNRAAGPDKLIREWAGCKDDQDKNENKFIGVIEFSLIL